MSSKGYGGCWMVDNCGLVALGAQHHAAERSDPNYRMGGPGQKEVLLPWCFHDFNHPCNGLPGKPHPHSTPGQAYITTYELVRKYVSQYTPSNTVKSLVAGGAASLVAQTITVPIDVVSQQLMMQGQGEHLTRFKVKPKMMLAATKRKPTFGQTRDITVQIFAADGFRGFYRGYVASLLTYIPNSALWWPFYHFYAEQLSLLAPSACPHLILQALAGPMAAATASTITNPMDVVRARVQVEGRSSVIETFKQLLAEEGAYGMTKGLSARIISSTPTSVLIVVGYETLKRLSLRADLVESRHW
ncbi:solute carrier family 25 member 44-like [Solea senegalensis]|uniref:Solute carrier family 25 member 44-like n=1 Tax=Solea senegalensis TaxID=28829 RepID=A0AAV6SZI5_SOLSE|nr:solute carrier family 25 member 44-like [Solea senegalensis]